MKKLEVGDVVKVVLRPEDYDYKKWNDFVSRIVKIVDGGWGKEQYELEGCSLSFLGEDLERVGTIQKEVTYEPAKTEE